MDFRQTKSWAKYLTFLGWKAVPLPKRQYLYIFHLPFFGYLIRISRIASPIPFAEIDRVAKKHRALFVKIEPDALIDRKTQENLKKWGFAIDNWSIEPTKTLIIDLNLKKDQIFSAFKPKWRQNIRFAAKFGVRVKYEDDIATFINIWQQNAKNKRHLIEKPDQTRVFWSEFRKQNRAFILTAFFQGEAIASALLIFWNKTCHLWHLGYSGKYKQLKPLYLLVWECILFAKNKGMRNFDFEGIEDTRYPYSKRTQGSYFKKGFGGKEKEYPGSFIKFYNSIRFYNPFANIAYQIVSRINPGLFRLFFKSKPTSY